MATKTVEQLFDQIIEVFLRLWSLVRLMVKDPKSKI
jgi:hypothetical protein